MKERPILFSGPMVRAILEGRKTQTRRVCKPQPSVDFLARGVVDVVPQWPTQDGVRWFMADGLSELVRCPHGKPGDRLWVKETFLYRAQKTAILCRADMEATEAAGVGAMYGGWRPSIFMPRTASRITLEITGVRVERLCSISEPDAVAEGVGCPERVALDVFSKLWDSINGKKYPWSSNPFIWRIEFKPISRPLKGANA